MISVLGALTLCSGAVISLTWMLAQGAWHWTFIAWISAQILTLWLGVYGSRQGYDAIGMLDGLDDEGARAIEGNGAVRVRLLGQLAFWGGLVAAGASALGLTAIYVGMMVLAIG